MDVENVIWVEFDFVAVLQPGEQKEVVHCAGQYVAGAFGDGRPESLVPSAYFHRCAGVDVVEFGGGRSAESCRVLALHLGGIYEYWSFHAATPFVSSGVLP